MAFLTSSHLRLSNYMWQQSQGKCHSRSFRVIFYVICFSFCFVCLMALWTMHAQSVIQWKGFLHFPETYIVHCKTLNLTIWHFCCEGEKQRNKEIEKNVNHTCTGMKCININFASGLPQNDNMAKTLFFNGLSIYQWKVFKVSFLVG